MIARFSLLLLISFFSFATERPQLGTYVFVRPFELEGCVKYVGGSGIAGGRCLETAKKYYKIGDKIKVEEFFWHDDVKNFQAKVVVFDQNRSVPLAFIQLEL